MDRFCERYLFVSSWESTNSGRSTSGPDYKTCPSSTAPLTLKSTVESTIPAQQLTDFKFKSSPSKKDKTHKITCLDDSWISYRLLEYHDRSVILWGLKQKLRIFNSTFNTDQKSSDTDYIQASFRNHVTCSRFSVNNIFTVVFYSKWIHVSRSRVTVNGISLMSVTYHWRTSSEKMNYTRKWTILTLVIIYG